MQKTWGGRFTGGTDQRVEQFTESISFDHRLYQHDIIASTASAPAFSACCESSIASVVEFEPAPAITGTRPRAWSTHHSTISLCSS